jgi:hypothetical protein
MRTTIDIPDSLYRQLRKRAAQDGVSAKAFILRGVEVMLRDGSHAPRQRVTLPLVPSQRRRPLQLDNARIYRIISFP